MIAAGTGLVVFATVFHAADNSAGHLLGELKQVLPGISCEDAALSRIVQRGPGMAVHGTSTIHSEVRISGSPACINSIRRENAVRTETGLGQEPVGDENAFTYAPAGDAALWTRDISE
ncbi:hypothetical protein G4G27_14060 [Sphingomonas sp. So64.6b]|uniref:hypothetical protein n=1 Tax=Sphingomonas sp. So64.6b TaxID=2997354 RepID=UPI00160348A7|nr:hypothetical protein [Sphingomonas sp. So64.6b]QNA84994.1 hypothetical protein G4G27_14060 [Sphingomonas sp. So64.6b]